MRTVIQKITNGLSPESFIEELGGERSAVLLRSASFDATPARYSFVAPFPFLQLRVSGSRCEFIPSGGGLAWEQFGNPWEILSQLLARYEILDEADLPFPLGGCFGYWGYDLKNALEPRLPRRAVNDLGAPDAVLNFCDCLLVYDHQIGATWIISTGTRLDGSRDEGWARDRAGALKELLTTTRPRPGRDESIPKVLAPMTVGSNLSRGQFIERVERAKRYIRQGDIYQVNLSHRLAARTPGTSWELFNRLMAFSPAPFAGYFDCGSLQLASSSPELFLRLSGSHIETRPIKGTRPRSSDPTRDAQLTYELQTSPKEMAELVMITDLLRNDLGRVCEFGTVHVPELVRLERFPQVQHLVSTVEGRLRPEVTHSMALASCFPGGSITGAPKIRAMEIIDELEPVTRGPYTGCLGYLGFNRESQLSILIRTVVCQAGHSYFHAGAGIVADSQADAEYDETLAKAAGFLAALNIQPQREFAPAIIAAVDSRDLTTDSSDDTDERSLNL